MARKVCPACGAANDLKATVCEECGAVLKKGGRPELRRARARGTGSVGDVLLDLFPGLLNGRTRAWVAIAWLTAIALALHGYSYARLQTAPAAIVVGVLAMACYCTGLMWLIYGYLCLPMEALLAFDGKRWLTLLILAAVPVVVVAAVPFGLGR